MKFTRVDKGAFYIIVEIDNGRNISELSERIQFIAFIVRKRHLSSIRIYLKALFQSFHAVFSSSRNTTFILKASWKKL